MVFVTFHFAYWQHGLSMLDHDHGDHMMVQIHRISMIPTPRMIELNQTSWGPGWNNSLGRTEFYIKDNHQAVNYATLVAIFFAISAFFHLSALIAGAFESCWCATRRKPLFYHNVPTNTPTYFWQVLVLEAAGARPPF